MSKAEEHIRKNTNQFSNEDGFDYIPWLTPDQAREAVKIARDEMVEKAIKWVEYNNKNGSCKFDGWVKDIKQAMKDE